MSADDRTVNVRAVRPAVELLKAKGFDGDAFLREWGIEPRDFDNLELRMPARLFDGFWQRAAEIAGDANFGLHVGDWVPLDALEMLSYLVSTSSTLKQSVLRVCRYFRVLADGISYSWYAEGEDLCFVRHNASGFASCRQDVEASLAIPYRYWHDLVEQPWSAKRVCFQHQEPADTGEHERFFAAPLQFSAAFDGFVIPAEALELPLNRADPNLSSMLERLAEQRIDGLPKLGDFSERAAAAIEDGLKDEGGATIESTAARLNVAPRVLQRRLKDHGLTHRTLLESVRKRIALSWIARPGVTLAELAFLLGYAEQAVFQRAFKRWTGQTPLAYRSTLVSTSGP